MELVASEVVRLFLPLEQSSSWTCTQWPLITPRVCTALPGSPAIVTLGRDVSLCYFPSLLGVCVLFSLMYLGR